MQAPIPATIITGFLGAGKTTLIQNLIRQANGKRIALIVNEFGDLGFDGEQIAGCGIEGCADDDVIELTNGCICCTVADDFLPTMSMLLDRDPAPDHIIIETSGLALPHPLVQAFRWPDVAARTRVDGVVTVADAEALANGHYAPDRERLEAQRAADESVDHETPIDALFADQMSSADLIVLSKSDRLDADQLDGVRARLSDRSDGVGVVVSTASGLPSELLIGLHAPSDTHDDAHHDDHHHHHHDHDEFASTVIEPGQFPSKAALDSFVTDLCALPGILRVKGIAEIAGKSTPAVVQAVGPRVSSHFDLSGRPQRAGLVVIGTSPLADLSAVMSSLDAA